MSDILNLESFRIMRLILEEAPPEESLGLYSGPQEVDYTVLSNRNDPQRYLMILRTRGKIRAGQGEGEGPTFDIVGGAEFRAPENQPREVKYAIVAMNGGAILYGLIRGQVAMASGSFPSGSVLLPTLNWQDVVNAVEERRDKVKAAKPPRSEVAHAVETPSKTPHGPRKSEPVKAVGEVRRKVAKRKRQD